MIKFELGDWRTNASVLGLIRILEHNERDFIRNETSIEVSEEILDGLENDYFAYFSDRYEEDLAWFKIVSYFDKLNKKIGNIESIDEKDLEELNRKIENAKKYLTSASWTKVYPLIENSDILKTNAKSMKKINIRKKENIEDRYEDILLEMNKLKEAIEILKQEDAEKHIKAKIVIYNYINRGINGVSFLNSQTKFINVFEDYKNYFINPLKENIENTKKSKNPYECFSCHSEINSLRESFATNLVNQTGFDDSRKSSHIWNHVSDILICPKCNFLYSMISAGFNYSLSEGMFINYSRNIEGLEYSNNSAKAKIENIRKEDNKALSYRSIVAAVQRQSIDDLDYEAKEIQIVRYTDGKYHFNILSNEVVKIIKKAKEDLKEIEKASYKEGNSYFNIYDEVLDRIFNGQNMFSLIHFLLVNSISKNSGLTPYYNMYDISKINNINYEILKGGINMDKLDMKKQIYFTQIDGNELRQEYLKKDKENKIAGISYRLLNALKTRNAEAFMHNVLNAYMYLNKPVPQNITLTLEDEENLGLLGYAFVTGLNGSKSKSTNNNVNKDGSENNEENDNNEEMK